MADCELCPRNCHINRDAGPGACGVTSQIKLALAGLHYWEEPCISGKEGSGAVFFSGCPLHCLFCQNEEISWGKRGKIISQSRLRDIFLELQEKGANNINLVTGTHYIPSIAQAIREAKSQGLHIPVIYNTSGYEKVESLRLLDGLVDVYLPDFKYMDPELAEKYSKAYDYPKVAKEAFDEMVRQCPSLKFDEKGMILSGVIARQLLLPGHVRDGKNIVEYLYKRYGDNIYISLMSQYTPMKQVQNHPELNRRVTKREYNALVNYALELGITNAFIQERKVAQESFIPDFNGQGL